MKKYSSYVFALLLSALYVDSIIASINERKNDPRSMLLIASTLDPADEGEGDLLTSEQIGQFDNMTSERQAQYLARLPSEGKQVQLLRYVAAARPAGQIAQLFAHLKNYNRDQLWAQLLPEQGIQLWCGLEEDQQNEVLHWMSADQRDPVLPHTTLDQKIRIWPFIADRQHVLVLAHMSPEEQAQLGQQLLQNQQDGFLQAQEWVLLSPEEKIQSVMRMGPDGQARRWMWLAEEQRLELWQRLPTDQQIRLWRELAQEHQQIPLWLLLEPGRRLELWRWLLNGQRDQLWLGLPDDQCDQLWIMLPADQRVRPWIQLMTNNQRLQRWIELSPDQRNQLFRLLPGNFQIQLWAQLPPEEQDQLLTLLPEDLQISLRQAREWLRLAQERQVQELVSLPVDRQVQRLKILIPINQAELLALLDDQHLAQLFAGLLNSNDMPQQIQLIRCLDLDPARLAGLWSNLKEAQRNRWSKFMPISQLVNLYLGSEDTQQRTDILASLDPDRKSQMLVRLSNEEARGMGGGLPVEDGENDQLRALAVLADEQVSEVFKD
jgi:Mg/Co/Ni transporter MgtE